MPLKERIKRLVKELNLKHETVEDWQATTEESLLAERGNKKSSKWGKLRSDISRVRTVLKGTRTIVERIQFFALSSWIL